MNKLQVPILSGGFCIASTKIWDIVRSVAKDRKVCQYYISQSVVLFMPFVAVVGMQSV